MCSLKYPEPMLDERKRRRKKSIAGIDQDELVDPKQLADPDSCFCEFKGVEIHHKVYSGESQEQEPLDSEVTSQLPNQTKNIGFPMILLHGFGASLFSWDRVMKPLAEACGSKVLAFDRPAFGLTSRAFQHLSSSSDDTKPLNPYSMAFSVLATLYFIDILAAEKAILVGYASFLFLFLLWPRLVPISKHLIKKCALWSRSLIHFYWFMFSGILLIL